MVLLVLATVPAAADTGRVGAAPKAPALSADLFGDWREEVVWRAADSRARRIYATTAPTDRRITTLMHDPQHRMAVAFDGMATPPRPAIYVR